MGTRALLFALPAVLVAACASVSGLGDYEIQPTPPETAPPPGSAPPGTAPPTSSGTTPPESPPSVMPPPPVPPPAEGIACGTATCSGGDVCCLASETDFVCSKSCPVGAPVFRCDRPSQCAPVGSVCCALLSESFGTSCTAAASCGAPGGAKTCRTVDDCAANEACVEVDFPYMLCVQD